MDPSTRLVWQMYTASQNDKQNKQIIVLLHGICGTAGCYFYLLEKLADAGFTCHSLQYPEYQSVNDWIHGLLNVLEYLKCPKVCVFASDLGGFLMLQFLTMYPNTIDELILCNSYSREQLAREFMANQLDQLEASQLASRIILQLSEYQDYEGHPIKFNQANILIIETSNSEIPLELTEDLKNCFPGAKVATMKSGGNFPYLTQADELVLYIRVFLQGRKNGSLQEGEDTSAGDFYGVESD